MEGQIKFKTLYLDAPWNEIGGGKIRRGADRHYDLMKTPDIIKLVKEVLHGKVANEAHLYIWVTNNFIRDGFEVIDALGFKYITKVTWFKDGKPGLGQYFRGLTEDCLFARRGVLPYKTKEIVVKDKIVTKRCQGVTGFVAPRGEHSEKPEEMRKMIETVSYAPYFELFARDEPERNNWTYWGNEIRQDEK